MDNGKGIRDKVYADEAVLTYVELLVFISSLLPASTTASTSFLACCSVVLAPTKQGRITKIPFVMVVLGMLFPSELTDVGSAY